MTYRPLTTVSIHTVLSNHSFTTFVNIVGLNLVHLDEQPHHEGDFLSTKLTL
jgi:hypothetical protein